jgi:endonuclease/exonuclease/phosphatase family metal-dependent hydrolase
LRIATFNLESLDEHGEHGTSLDARIAVLWPMLTALNAEVLCLQEVNGQATRAGRTLAALAKLLEGTAYAAFASAHSGDNSGRPRDVHNLVTTSRFPIRAKRQVRHEFITAPLVRTCTVVPAPPNASEVTWDRPLLHVTLDVAGRPLDVINLHLRAPLSVMIPGQKESAHRWTNVPA